MRRHALLLAVLAAAFPAAVAAQTGDAALPPPRYTVQDEPRTGSNISRAAVTGNVVPLNRTYAQLTPAEKGLVRSQYETMAPDDEPPFPLDGLFPLQNAIHKIVRATGEPGVIALLARVDASGGVTAVEVMQAADADLLNRAAAVLMRTPFKPAVCAGQPCAMGFPLRMRVTIEHY